jgi:hypothetical protein
VTAGAQLDRMSARTGVSVEALSALGYAAEQSGSSLDTVEAGLAALQGKLVSAAQGGREAQDAFLMLGLSWRQLAELDAASQVQILAEQISKVEHPARRAQAALAVFGTTELLPLLKGGAAGLREMTGEAERLGLTMSGGAAKDAQQLAAGMNTLKRSLQAVAVAVGGSVAPLLADAARAVVPLVKYFADWARENKTLVAGIAAGVAVVAGLGAGLIALGSAVGVASFAFSGLSTAVGVVSTLAATLWPVGVVAAKVGLAVGALAAAVYLAARGVNALAGVKVPQREGSGNKVKDAALHVWDTVATAAGVAWDKVQRVAGDRATRVGKILGAVGDRAREAWGVVRDTAAEAWGSVKGTASTAMEGITAAVKAGRWDLVFSIASAAVQLEWAKLTGFLQGKWLDFRGWWDEKTLSMKSLAAEAWAGVQAVWVETTSFLIGDWEGFSGRVSNLWDNTVSNLKATWQFFGDLYRSIVDSMKQAWQGLVGVIDRVTGPIRRALAPILDFFNSPAGRKILGAAGLAIGAATISPAGLIAGAGARNAAEGKGILGTGDAEANRAQREGRLSAIEDERRARQAQIEEARKSGQAARAAELEEMQKRLAERKAALEQELADNVNAAKEALAKRRAEGGDELRGKGPPGLGGGLKADVSGSFNSFAAAGFGGRTVADRIADNTGAMKDGIQQMLQELKNPRRAPIVGD